MLPGNIAMPAYVLRQLHRLGPHRAARLPVRGEESVTSLAMQLLDRDLVPDFLIRRRIRIRSLLATRLRKDGQLDPERQQQRLRALMHSLTRSASSSRAAAGAR